MSDEFELRTGLDARDIDPQQVQWPLDTFVLYSKDDSGAITGRIAAMNLTVIEGTYVREDRRGTTLAFRLLKWMENFLSKRANKTHSLALVYDETPEVAEYLKRVGYERFPVTLYSKDLVRKPEAA